MNWQDTSREPSLLKQDEHIRRAVVDSYFKNTFEQDPEFLKQTDKIRTAVKHRMYKDLNVRPEGSPGEYVERGFKLLGKSLTVAPVDLIGSWGGEDNVITKLALKTDELWNKHWRPEPPTGKFARPPGRWMEYLDPERALMVLGEGGPLLATFAVMTLANPSLGMLFMAAVEGGETTERMRQYEEKTGKVIDPRLRRILPTVVGSVNAILERAGLEFIFRAGRATGLKQKIVRAMLSAPVEGTQEAAQEVNQIIAEYGYSGVVSEDAGERVVASAYAGTVLGGGAGTVSAAIGTAAEVAASKDKPKTMPQIAQVKVDPRTGAPTVVVEGEEKAELSVEELKNVTEFAESYTKAKKEKWKMRKFWNRLNKMVSSGVGIRMAYDQLFQGPEAEIPTSPVEQAGFWSVFNEILRGKVKELTPEELTEVVEEAAEAKVPKRRRGIPPKKKKPIKKKAVKKVKEEEIDETDFWRTFNELFKMKPEFRERFHEIITLGKIGEEQVKKPEDYAPTVEDIKMFEEQQTKLRKAAQEGVYGRVADKESLDAKRKEIDDLRKKVYDKRTAEDIMKEQKVKVNPYMKMDIGLVERDAKKGAILAIDALEARVGEWAGGMEVTQERVDMEAQAVKLGLNTRTALEMSDDELSVYLDVNKDLTEKVVEDSKKEAEQVLEEKLEPPIEDIGANETSLDVLREIEEEQAREEEGPSNLYDPPEDFGELFLGREKRKGEVRGGAPAFVQGKLTEEAQAMLAKLQNLYPEVDVDFWNKIYGSFDDSGAYHLAHSALIEGREYNVLRGVADVREGIGAVVKFSRGDADIGTFPHEYAHIFTDMLSEDPLIQEGLLMFRPLGMAWVRQYHPSALSLEPSIREEWIDRGSREVLSGHIEDYFINRANIESTILPRFEDWVKRFISKLRMIFGKHSSEDVARIIGDRFFRGKRGPHYGMEPEAARRAKARIVRETGIPGYQKLARESDLVDAGKHPGEDLDRVLLGEDRAVEFVKPVMDVNPILEHLQTPLWIGLRQIEKADKKGTEVDKENARIMFNHTESLLKADLMQEHYRHKDMNYARAIYKGLSKEQRESLRGLMKVIYSGDKKKMLTAVRQDRGSFVAAYRLTRLFRHKLDFIKRQMRVMFKQHYHDTKVGEALESVLQTGEFETALEEFGVKASSLLDALKTYQSIDSWGLDDYITNMELGSLKMMDVEGNTIGIALNRRDAMAKALDYFEKHPGATTLTVNGDLGYGGDLPSLLPKNQYNQIAWKFASAVKDLTADLTSRLRADAVRKSLGRVVGIKPAYKFAGPLMKRKGVLEGEKDITKVVPAYLYAVNKKMILDPVIEQIRKNIFRLPENMRKVVENQLEAVRGRYYIEDAIVDGMINKMDKILESKFGVLGGTNMKPMTYSRLVAKFRFIAGNLKLGWRPVAAFVNLEGGLGHVWVKVGIPYVRRARQLRKTPEGRALLQEEDWSLGSQASLATEATGGLSGKPRIWQGKLGRAAPLHMFQSVEPYVREISYIANYLYAKEKMKMSEEAARETARKAVWFQEFIYTVGNMPKWMRSPTGRLVGQFKSYIIQELQYIRGLRGTTEWLRYAGMHMAMGGPRGMVFLLKTIPFIAAFMGINRLEEWMSTNAPRLSRGLVGLAGGDITAPATFQFPTRPEDWFGPFLSDIIKLNTKVLRPFLSGEGLVGENAKEWAFSIAPISYYWRQLVNGMLSDDGWVRDYEGKKMYKFDAWWDSLLLLGGAGLSKKTQADIVRRNIALEEEKRRNTQRRIVERILGKISNNKPLTRDDYSDITRWQVSREAIENGARRRALSPRQWQLLRTRLLKRPEVARRWPWTEGP